MKTKIARTLNFKGTGVPTITQRSDGVTELDFGGGSETDTLDTVTTRGNTTTNDIDTGKVTATKNALGVTTVDAFVAVNTTPATVSLSQVSPAVRWSGRGWKTSTTAASQVVDFFTDVLPVQGLNNPLGLWKLKSQINGGTINTLLDVDSRGVFDFYTISGLGPLYTASFNGNFQNSQPGTTSMLRFNNAGSHTWFDFNFGGVSRSNIGADNAGGIRLYMSGGSFFELYNKAGNSLYMYSFPSGILHTGWGVFTGGVHAGGVNAPTSTLQSAGSTALRTRKTNVNITLGNTATKWVVDASTSEACSGTPSSACSSHTTEVACNARNNHGGCTWFAGNSCSAFNNESGMGNCTANVGCTVVTTACTGGDETACLANDDAYGGSCSWTENFTSCSPLDEGTCSATGGCTANYGDCAPHGDAGGDGSACSAYNASCSYDWGSGACSGAPYINCSGTYSTGFTCGGSYNTGECSGMYGSSCSGTPTCSGVSNANCENETGCSVTTAINIALPDMATCPDRDYWIYKDGATGSVVLTPFAGQLVDLDNTYSMTADKEWVHISPFIKTDSCSSFNQATCEATSGCSTNTSNCVWDFDVCTGGGVCAGAGDEMTCNGTTYFTGCSGSYVVNRNWYVFGK